MQPRGRAESLAEANRQKAKQEEEAKLQQIKSKHDAFAAAIGNVVAERSQISQESTKKVSQHSEPYLNQRLFCKGLHRVDTSKCPAAFQIAWRNYLSVFERELSLGHVVSELSSLAHGELGALDSHEPADAWSRCETVALEFGVAMKQ